MAWWKLQLQQSPSLYVGSIFRTHCFHRVITFIFSRKDFPCHNPIRRLTCGPNKHWTGTLSVLRRVQSRVCGREKLPWSVWRIGLRVDFSKKPTIMRWGLIGNIKTANPANRISDNGCTARTQVTYSGGFSNSGTLAVSCLRAWPSSFTEQTASSAGWQTYPAKGFSHGTLW